jgi:hypothetical protein
MGFLVFLLTLICYGLAIYLWWDQQKPIYVFALLSGHVGSLASPLWTLLYGVQYSADFSPLLHVLGSPLPFVVFLGAAWFYTLPALLVFYLYATRWWVSGYFAGLVTYGAFLFYHTILESVGLRLGIWFYTDVLVLPFGISNALISTLMAALISLTLLYLLLLVRRFSMVSMLLVLLPATLLINLLVRGLLGAPLWLVISVGPWLGIDVQSWVIAISGLITLALLVAAVHIVARGLARMEWHVA